MTSFHVCDVRPTLLNATEFDEGQNPAINSVWNGDNREVEYEELLGRPLLYEGVLCVF